MLGLVQKATGLELSEIIERLLNEDREVGWNVRTELNQLSIPYHVWSDQLESFYAQTNAFLFETIVWNRTAFKQATRAWITSRLHHPPMRILCFGDGLGFDSLYFAKQGHTVDYLEVSLPARRFASQLFTQENVEVGMVTDQELESKCYDAILVLDVLEHLPNPIDCVRFLAKHLRPGGQFFASAPFWLLTPAVATHLRSNFYLCGKISKLYGSADLRPRDAFQLWNPILLEKPEQPSDRYRDGASLAGLSRVWMAGYVLWWTRWWNRPLIWLVHRLFRSKHQPWNDLVSFSTRKKLLDANREDLLH